MTKQEALAKIKELEDYINNLDDYCGFGDDTIFLLSKEEYEKYRRKIPRIAIWWWLRSPGYSENFVTGVRLDGSVGTSGYNVDYVSGGVRPALKYANLTSVISKSKEIDCFMWNDIKWKIIDSEKEIAIAYMPISFDIYDDEEDNNYENSYIRKWLLQWHPKKGV